MFERIKLEAYQEGFNNGWESGLSNGRNLEEKASEYFRKSNTEMINSLMKENADLKKKVEKLEKSLETLGYYEKHDGKVTSHEFKPDFTYFRSWEPINRSKKVFVIGSLMASKISKAVEKYWAEGYEVEYAELDPGRPTHEIIDDTFKKIKDADIIVAIMKSESEKFGEGTLYEIAYARSLGKKVEVLTDNF